MDKDARQMLFDLDRNAVRSFASALRGRGHLYLEGLTLYLRLGPRVIDPVTQEAAQCIVIADANATPKSQGRFTAFLEAAETLLRDDAFMPPVLFVENVVNPRLAAFLRRRGYVYTPVGHAPHVEELTPSFHRRMRA